MPIIAVIIIGIATFFGGGLIAQKGDLNKTISGFASVFNSGVKEVSPTTTPFPTEYSYPTETPKTIQYIVPTIDPDPIINCNVHSNCGGGTKLLKKSICDNSICCQIRNQWLFYNDKSQCFRDQQVTSVTNSNPLPNVQNSNQSVSNIANKNCRDAVNINVASCNNTCNVNQQYNRTACINAYSSSSPGANSTKFDECLTEEGQEYNTCLTNCTNNQNMDLQKC